MKIPFLISSHPCNEERTIDLLDCSSRIKNIIKDSFMITSCHCFPFKNENFDIDYFIVDPKNEMLTKEDIFEMSSFNSMFYWNNFFSNGVSNIFLSRGEVLSLKPMHHYAAFKNILNGVKFLKSFGFEYFISCDADIKFSESDLMKFYKDCELLSKNNQGGMVFKSSYFGTSDAAIFCCKIDYFLDYCDSVKNKEDYKKLTKGDGFLIEKILDRMSSLYNFNIVKSPNGNESVNEYFNTSVVNIPSQKSSLEIPIFTLCTKNELSGFFNNSNWINENYSNCLSKPNFEISEPDKLFLLFLQRGDFCKSATLIFSDELNEVIFENNGFNLIFNEVDFSKQKKILSLYGKITLEGIFEFENKDAIKISFVFNKKELFLKYLNLNQIVEP